MPPQGVRGNSATGGQDPLTSCASSTGATRDVGAGTGYAHRPRRPRDGPDGNVHCVDGSGPLLDVLEKRAAREGLAPQVTTEVGALAPLPAPDTSLDLVLCTYVLHKLAETAAAVIAERHRVLRPGGRVAIADYRTTSDIARNRESEAWYARQPGGAGPDGRHLRFSLEELEEMPAAASAARRPGRPRACACASRWRRSPPPRTRPHIPAVWSCRCPGHAGPFA